MVTKAEAKVSTKKFVGPTYVNPQKISFLLCYKYKDELKKDFVYYQLIPLGSEKYSNKFVDLRTNKGYNIPAQSDAPFEQYKAILADYGITSKSPPTLCKTLDYVTTLNYAFYCGVFSKIFFKDNVSTSERIDQELIVSLCDDIVGCEKHKSSSKAEKNMEQ